ncbi:MAG: hypothetical protein BZY82_04400 [SAR202 cluster bacterium Io17-Chloro-G3]|nr:MAG: hypothetical protein BZY82_04400 [SAR202 cluster bacterium Io17-Chloro-G3]
MSKDNHDITQTLELVNEEWQKFLNVTRLFSKEEQTTIYLIEAWTIKDLLGHIATWDRETLLNMERFQKGEKETQYRAIDDRNKAASDLKSGFSLEQAWVDLEGCHQKLIDYLKALPQELLESRRYSQRQILGETINHYKEHRDGVERWRTTHE